MGIINTNINKLTNEKEPINTGFCPSRTGIESPLPEKHFYGSVSSHDLVFHTFGHNPEKQKTNILKLNRTITK